MKIPELHIGHSNTSFGRSIMVKNAVYRDENELESGLPHRHNFYMICLIRSGSGIHMIDFEEITVKPNRLFIIKPYQVHFWKLDSNTDISLIQFEENMLQLESMNSLSVLNLRYNFTDVSIAESGEIAELAMKLEMESGKIDTFSADIIKAYLVVLCGLIGRIAKLDGNQQPADHKEEKLQRFTTLIEQNFREQKGVSFYASQLNITPNYLNMLSRQILGKNAGDMILSRIMLEAKRLLYHTTSDISQIAFDLGYEDPSYFTRSFRRLEKKTPSEFREEIYKKYRHRNN